MGIGRLRLPALIMPAESLRAILGRENIAFNNVRFYIDPAQNRLIHYFRDEMQEILTRAGLIMTIEDEDLRIAVGPLEQNLNMLRQLRPITLALSALLSAGMAALLTVKNAKNAAIMRALGKPKLAAAFAVWVEYIAVCVAGAALSLPLMLLAGIDVLSLSLAAVAVYLAGAAVGAAVGTFVITSRPPLSLLQAKE